MRFISCQDKQNKRFSHFYKKNIVIIVRSRNKKQIKFYFSGSKVLKITKNLYFCNFLKYKKSKKIGEKEYFNVCKPSFFLFRRIETHFKINFFIK